MAKKTWAMSVRSWRKPKSLKLFKDAACSASRTSGVITNVVVVGAAVEASGVVGASGTVGAVGTIAFEITAV